MATKHAVGALSRGQRLVVPREVPTRLATRFFSSQPHKRQELESHAQAQSQQPPPPASNPSLAGQKDNLDSQQKINEDGKPLRRSFGSRRRRQAIEHSTEIPFEQLPYQCFQEARKVLAQDRQEKVKQIGKTRERISQLADRPSAECGGEARKQLRLSSMRTKLEELKIQADINDPIVKKIFEDGFGDMNKPIYRFLADSKWRTYKRKVIMQRITQMTVIPDVCASIDPVADVQLAFGKQKIQPGDKVDSRLSQQCPTLNIQPFDKGERLVTVVIVDSDVPDPENDKFGYRCHGIFTNIPVSPTKTKISLRNLPQNEHVVMKWLPPTSQKGAPYHRLSIWVLQHPADTMVDVDFAREMFSERDGFILRRFLDKWRVKWANKPFNPIGVTMFRTEWDENMEEVMKRHGVAGWDVELRKEKITPLPYRKKDSARYR